MNSKGAINRIIDGLLHKKAGKDPVYAVVDGALHFLNEVVVHGDPPEKSLYKFVKFNTKFLYRLVRR
ncbi:MAG: hypothetical protein ACTSSA_12490 [Candidatus Freyarchaeota archaeon]